MIPADTILYTWLDVEDVLLRLQADGSPWPVWLLGARTYWDSLTLLIRPGTQDQAEDWIQSIFDPRVLKSPDNPRVLKLALESTVGMSRSLLVAFEEIEEQLPNPRLTPSFARPGILQPSSLAVLEPAPLLDNSPRLFAFHSFKGGVGRTMHAVALAAAIAKKKGNVLLVDADFEAPGITAMLEKRLPQPPISFADVISLAHGDTSLDLEETVALATRRLRDSNMDGIFVLPAFRSSQAFTSLEIRPEHLVHSHGDAFLLTHLLLKLASSLGVDAVVVDLRAGLSELSAGLLLDPRVQRILVTTLSGQSVEGTLAVLKLIEARAPSQRDGDPFPNIVINQVPLEYSGSDSLRRIEDELLLAASKANRGALEASEPLRNPTELVKGPTLFDSNLMLLPASWDEAIGMITRSGISETVRPYVDELPAPAVPNDTAADVSEQRRRLSTAAADLVYAERSETTDFLATSPLRRLALDHKTQVPITIVVGAKGAGKTYTFLQLVRRETWSRFATDAASSSETVHAELGPTLSSISLSEPAAALVRTAKQRVAKEVGTGEAMLDPLIRDNIRAWLRNDLHEGEWREIWLDIIAWSMGFKPDNRGVGREFISELRNAGRKIITVIDGLEDVFQNLPSSAQEQAALRSLLQELPNWLSQEPERPLGVIVFVRRDMVLNAVKQNPGQLIGKYDPYALRWDRTEALRLVLWVCVEAKYIAGPRRPLLEFSEAELIEALIPLWGRKLGPDRSREGRSAEWVIAALSDFRGQIQARDLVRFLHLAAGHSERNPEAWSDRVLVPNAIREAVADCSKEKITEILQENPRLGEVLTHLRNLPDDKRWVPFTQQLVQLSADQVALLEANGVVISEHGEYYMPEIFRRGLGFGLPQGARPKVLALARRRGQGTP